MVGDDVDVAQFSVWESGLICVTDMSQVAQLVLVVLFLQVVNISPGPNPQYGGKSRLGLNFILRHMYV